MSTSSTLNHVFGHIPSEQRHSPTSTPAIEIEPSLTEEPQLRPQSSDLEQDAESTSYSSSSIPANALDQTDDAGIEADQNIPGEDSQLDEEEGGPALSIDNGTDSLDDSLAQTSAPSGESAGSHAHPLGQTMESLTRIENGREEPKEQETETQNQDMSEESRHGDMDWMVAEESDTTDAGAASAQYRVEHEVQAGTEGSSEDEETTLRQPTSFTDLPEEESVVALPEYGTESTVTQHAPPPNTLTEEPVYHAEIPEAQTANITSTFEGAEDDWEQQLGFNNGTSNLDGGIGVEHTSIEYTTEPQAAVHASNNASDVGWLQTEDIQPPSRSAAPTNSEPDMSWMGADGSDVPASAVTATPSATQPETLGPFDNDQQELTKPAVEDSWAQAFGDPAVLDDTWGAAFADDEEGFLEDEPVPVPAAATTKSRPTSLYAPANASVPTPSTSTPTAFAPIPAPFANAYGVAAAVQPQSVAQRSTSTPMQFFEDLPMNRPPPTRRPKQQILSPSPPTIPPPPTGGALPHVPGRPIAPPRTSSAAHQQYAQFRGPEKLDPFPPQPSVPNPVTGLDTQQVAIAPTESAPPINDRYSPAINQPIIATSSSKPPTPGTSRYASSQLAQPPQPFPQRAHSPYAPNSGMAASQVQPPPKTSTPVMFEELPTVRSPQKSRYAQPSNATLPPTTLQGQGPLAGKPAPPPAANRFVPRTSSPLAYAGAPARAIEQHSQVPPQQGLMQPPPNQHHGAAALSRPGGAPKLSERSVSYAPQQFMQPPLQEGSIPTPPVRPRTSSPVHMRAQPQLRNVVLDQPSTSRVSQTQSLNAPSTVEHDIQDFVVPQNETAMDQLQRWRGAPIFRWGAGGLMVSSIPKHIPRYGGGQSAPKLKPTSGVVKLQKAKDIITEDSGLSTFPGPLRSKGKKKDVITWMSARITLLEQMTASNTGAIRQAEEKVLLWKVVRLFVENDGVLTGNPSVTAAVKELLNIDTASSVTAVAPLTTDSPVTAKPGVVNDIRVHLIQGDREKAVWHAVDNELWGHALVLASTADNSLWKQVVQEFVKKQVRSTNQDSRSLAALYEVFAGNWDESIDQLVPLAARQGFHMINTADQSGQARDAAEGLEKWRETLTLIVNNRSNGDENALIALGKLLISYGRVEAAHVCYLFARNVAVFGGADDAQTHFTLLSADLASETSPKIADTDSILLTEVYEFALSLAPSAPTFFPPHLQSYKLQHAYQLAEIGLRSEGQQYCEAIGSALKSSTRGSPYYHPLLVAALDDLSKRLSQSPQNSSSGWISKLSADKVSGSVWSKFNKFVVGDDADGTQAAAAAQAEEAGPFGRIGTGTPTISRTPSAADFHPGNDMVRIPSNIGIGSGRYAPSAYGSSPEQNRPIQNQYAPSYGLSPDMLQKPFDRRLSQDNLLPAFGSPPRHPPFQRQSSTLSRYATNESSSAYEPSGMHSMTHHDPYVPLVAESVPEGVAVQSYPSSRRTSIQPASAYTPSAPVTPLMEYPSAPRPPNNRYSSSSAISDSRPSSAKYAPSATEAETTSAYAPLAPVEDVSTTTYKATNPPDEAEPYEPSAKVEDYDSTHDTPTAASNGYEPSPYGYQPYEPSAPSAATAEDEPGLTIDTALENEYQPEISGYNPMTGYEPSTSAYDPNAGGGYMPYQPDTEVAGPSAPVEEEDPEDAPRPKKKGIMDLDDEDDTFLQKQAEDLKRQQKAQRDREADELVRKAAEADGKFPIVSLSLPSPYC